MQLLPENKRRAPGPPSSGGAWRTTGSVVVSLGLAFAGIAVWLMLA
jgi:hypothetical protein